MTNTFITGSTGFIGSHLCNYLKEKNNIYALVRDIPPSSSTWGKWLKDALNGCTLVLGDVLNQRLLQRLINEAQINHVYHLASQAIVSTALKDPLGTLETNIMGTVNILEASRQIDAEKTLIMSTDKVFGDRMNATEHDPLVSTGIYETSKSCADLIAQSYMKNYDMSVIIARSCNAYGYDLSPRIIPNTIRSCLKGEAPIIYEGEETKRQYIHVTDLCEALVYLMKHPPYRGPYNIATNDLLTQKGVVLEICKHFPLTPRYVKRNKPIKEIHSQSIVCSKFGWTPKYSFSEGIQETIQKFSRERERIRKAQARYWELKPKLAEKEVEAKELKQ